MHVRMPTNELKEYTESSYRWRRGEVVSTTRENVGFECVSLRVQLVGGREADDLRFLNSLIQHTHTRGQLCDVSGQLEIRSVLLQCITARCICSKLAPLCDME